ncbi:DUF1127 domain-containing protein [Yoonia sp.]|jgi:uncharacterized protein YjiS (DUF1127 family)|uniref:DUF1127 domain-containing protein n=1 Tax=Yoonia sp. TaxID=2212373 RepID=UPI001BD0E42B|nr:DUF1127 domain-containing protein [Yoonia sp.]MDA0720392.1 DUF1127 domain-containing protein [Pseudomonadota bacterium]
MAMATFATNRTTVGMSAGFFVSLIGAFAAWNDARITRNALSKLSARELDDIGLCIGDIDMIATRTGR